MDICAGVVEDCLSVCTRRSSNVPPTYRGGGVVVFLFTSVPSCMNVLPQGHATKRLVILWRVGDLTNVGRSKCCNYDGNKECTQ